ncbi:MAG: putative anti-sigma regulatory factor, serine/threonine protein kinase [Actinomycetia bacterium]|nr:putative anti-sigma regulatory factor, serine/threonine protein kinase [Actinomycetes bacterium]
MGTTSETSASSAAHEALRLEVTGAAGATIAAAAVEAAARALDLPDDDAARLGAATDELCTATIARGFEHAAEARLTVSVLSDADEIFLRVDDQGFPRDLGEGGADSPITRMRALDAVDEVRQQQRGRAGHRTELVKRRPRHDVRDPRRTAGTLEPAGVDADAPPVDPDTPITVRFMTPDEAMAFSQCVYRCYGYSYDADFVYQPETVEAMLREGTMRSVIGCTPTGEIVGHLALMLDGPDDRVGEAGQAVVDPRYRSHHLFTTLKRYLADWASGAGMLGIFSEATAAHPYSQKANLALGAHETGFLLGYIPAEVSYTAIKEDEQGRRQSVALFYLATNAAPDRAVHAPPAYRMLLEQLYVTNGLARTFAPATATAAPLPGHTELDERLRTDHNQAVLTVNVIGADFAEVVHTRLRSLCLNHVDIVYLDVRLGDPAGAGAGATLNELGFFFGGVFPERSEGDVLRYQYLNNVEADPSDVSVASDFGRELLDFIWHRKDVVTR